MRCAKGARDSTARERAGAVEIIGCNCAQSNGIAVKKLDIHDSLRMKLGYLKAIAGFVYQYGFNIDEWFCAALNQESRALLLVVR